MRSKIGTQSRLAAHILALVLLILMLVYISPSPSVKATAAPARPAAAEPAAKTLAGTPLAEHAPPGDADTLDRIHARVTPEPAATATLRPPAAEPAPVEEPKTATTPDQTSLRPPETAEAISSESPPETPVETAAASVAADQPDVPALTGLRPTDEPEEAAPTPAEELAPFISDEGSDTLAPVSETEPSETPVADDSAVIAPQPDESGSLVVASADTGLTHPVAATTPLPNANLEVLGDGVYWLDPSHNLEAELAAIPEIGTLVLLTPLPGYRVVGFEHVKTEAIAADAADLDHDSAEHFLHVAADAKRPIVIAPLSGARGGAFFKGVYLLANRNLSTEEVLREIAPELDQAGEARHEIIHRLLSLARTMRP